MLLARIAAAAFALHIFAGPVLGQGEAEIRVQFSSCASQPFTFSCPSNRVITIKSITIYASVTDPTPLVATRNDWCTSNLNISSCFRTFKDASDQGFKELPEYDYFYKWLYIICYGKSTCNETMPAPNRLHGINKACSDVDIAYFVSAFTDIDCVSTPPALTFAPLPETTTPSPPPSSTEPTEAPPVLVPIASGSLGPTERIVLAVTICAAVIGLFLLLLLLYCCDKWRREKKKLEMLLRLGKAEERQDAVDEIREFAAKEAWMNETEHPEALGEYCGVKPEEVFTISRKTMDRSDKARQDGAATLQRGVGFATLQRGAGGDLQSANSMTTLTRAQAPNEYVNNAYIPPTFERMDMLHY